MLLAASFVLAQVFSYVDRTDPLSDVSESRPGAIGIYVSIVGFVVCLICFAYLLGSLGGSRASRVSKTLSRHKRALVTLAASVFLLGLYLFTWFFVWPAWY